MAPIGADLRGSTRVSTVPSGCMSSAVADSGRRPAGALLRSGRVPEPGKFWSPRHSGPEVSQPRAACVQMLWEVLALVDRTTDFVADGLLSAQRWCADGAVVQLCVERQPVTNRSVSVGAWDAVVDLPAGWHAAAAVEEGARCDVAVVSYRKSAYFWTAMTTGAPPSPTAESTRPVRALCRLSCNLTRSPARRRCCWCASCVSGRACPRLCAVRRGALGRSRAPDPQKHVCPACFRVSFSRKRNALNRCGPSRDSLARGSRSGHGLVATVTYRLGSEAKKKVCVPQIDLQFRARFDKFHLFPEEKNSVGEWLRRRSPGSHSAPAPPPPPAAGNGKPWPDRFAVGYSQFPL